MTPPRSILDRAFVYVPAHDTDLRATFKRIRHEQHLAEEARKAAAATAFQKPESKS